MSESAIHHNRKEQLRCHIRWLIRTDMPEVLDIEQDSYDQPWIEEDFLNCLRSRNCIGMVAEVNDPTYENEYGENFRVVGFMIYEMHKPRLHIINFAIHSHYRHKGVGAQMIAKLVSKLSDHRRKSITLEVRDTNLPAQLFFKAQGFMATKVLRDFFEGEEGYREDAYIMEYRRESNRDDE